MKKLAWVLVIIGAVNWGLVGIGGLFFGGEINLVSMIFGMSTLGYVIYLLVGLSAVYLLAKKCGCKGCARGNCEVHKNSNGQM